MTGKHSSVWRCGTAAMLVIAAMSSVHASAASAPAAFTPPQTTLLLTRTLHRALPDGKEVVTRRSYSVRIVPEGDGFRVDGTLVEANVDAPPSLAALAAIEKMRPDNGLFPIMLDAEGMIVDGGKVQADGSAARAAELAATVIAGAGLAAPDARQAQTFVKQLADGAPRSQWPADIFHPRPGKRHESRAMALADGGEGHVTIEIEARGSGSDGQLALLDRVVTTEMAGNTRVTREQWQLRQDGIATGR